jgi:hypothetical protein
LALNSAAEIELGWGDLLDPVLMTMSMTIA